MDRTEFNRQLAAAAREMADEKGTQLTLERAVQMTTDLLPTCDLAGISVIRSDRSIDTPAASHEALRLVDELQYRLREGPCLDAIRRTDVLVVDNLAEDPRWPEWGPRIAREVGVHSSMSLRLFTTGDTTGVLNCYAKQPGAFTSDDVLDGQALAAHAAVALAAALGQDQMLRGLETRRMIGEATGIVRERFGLTTDQAFGVLRRISSQRNVKLYVIAQQLVDTGDLPAGRSGHNEP